MTRLSRVFCPGAGSWERARVAGLDRALSRHLGSCETCRVEWEADARLRAIAAKTPVRELSADRLAAGREALLVRAQAGLAAGMSEPATRRMGRRFWASAAAAAALVAGGLWLGTPRVREPAGSFSPATSVARVEAKQGVGVQSPVQSASRATANLETFVRPPEADPRQELPAATGRGSARLKKSASARARSAVSTTQSREPSAGDAVDSTLAPSRPLGTAAEAAFREGWLALRAGQPALAAHWFGSVESGSAVAEDAHYWQGISLARAARLEQAVAVLERFVERYPRSLRRPEAALVLGWVHLQRNAEKRAASYFAEAMLTDDPATRQRAAQALAGINKRARLVPRNAAAL